MRLQETEHPLLYEINARLWLGELGRQRSGLTLAEVPDSILDEIASLHFDLVWMMGIWQTGAIGCTIARTQPGLQREYRQVLPDVTQEDIIGSPYAVQDYRVDGRLGGPEGLAALRRRLAHRGIGLILDLVPNHTACDHPWVFAHPEFYVHGDKASMAGEPAGFFTAETVQGKRILAHGRDPYFPAWSDTAQLNYRHPGLRAAMVDTLLEVARHCDGVRCDMAMLVLEEVFSRTWGSRAQPLDGPGAEGEFWAEAIDAVRRCHPDFLFIAEAYWGLEKELQALGFDFTYDKTFYDRLVHGGAPAVREHLRADPEYLARGVHFLENHDEPRAAQVFPAEQHRAAALIAAALPGLRFFHEGQLEGRRARVPVQLGRRPREPRDDQLHDFYARLLEELAGPVLRRGKWKPLEPRSAWEGNHSWEQFVVYRWEGGRSGSRVVVANYGPHRAQCYVPLDLIGLRGRRVLLRDLLSGVSYERMGDSLRNPGLYLDMAPYQVHLFAVVSR